jgi:hypothetical protein
MAPDAVLTNHPESRVDASSPEVLVVLDKPVDDFAREWHGVRAAVPVGVVRLKVTTVGLVDQTATPTSPGRIGTSVEVLVSVCAPCECECECACACSLDGRRIISA